MAGVVGTCTAVTTEQVDGRVAGTTSVVVSASEQGEHVIERPHQLSVAATRLQCCADITNLAHLIETGSFPEPSASVFDGIRPIIIMVINIYIKTRMRLPIKVSHSNLGLASFRSY